MRSSHALDVSPWSAIRRARHASALGPDQVGKSNGMEGLFMVKGYPVPLSCGNVKNLETFLLLIAITVGLCPCSLIED